MTGKRPSRQIPARRRSHRPSAAQRRRLGWRGSLSLVAVAAILILLAWGVIARRLAPTSITSLTRFDAIIVLGYPADSDGNPKPIQLARVTEAVHEYERGVAPRLIFTGGAVLNRFVEARVMARTAQAQGIPESAIFVEPEAKDTIQNACYAVRIMKAHGGGDFVRQPPTPRRADLQRFSAGVADAFRSVTGSGACCLFGRRRGARNS